MWSARSSASGRRCRRRCARPQGATLSIDQATRANLELVRTLGGERRGSLLAAIDRTVTSAGSRLLAQRLAAPLTDPAAIGAAARRRRDFRRRRASPASRPASFSTSRPTWRARCRGSWSAAAGRATSPPSATALAAAAALAARLDKLPRKCRRSSPARSPRCAAPDPALARELTAALADELPLFKRDGGFVRDGYEAALDESRALRDESRKVVAQLQARYADDTGVKSLKIRHNNVLGYFVEVTAQHGEKLLGAPLNATFIHRQTLAGQVRFTTTELGELEAKIANAADRALNLELEIFERLAAAVDRRERRDQGRRRGAGACSMWRAALATLAVERSYVRPEIDRSLDFIIEGGRHAVVEQAISDPFVANDCDLSPPKRREARGASGCSPARTWPASRRSCARTR